MISSLAGPTGPNSFVFAQVSAKKRPRQRSLPLNTGNPGSATEFLIVFTTDTPPLSMENGWDFAFNLKIHSCMFMAENTDSKR